MTPTRLVAAPPPGPDLPLTLLCVAVAVGYTALALGVWRLRPKPVPAAVGRRYRRWTRAEMRAFSPVLAERMNR